MHEEVSLVFEIQYNFHREEILNDVNGILFFNINVLFLQRCRFLNLTFILIKVLNFNILTQIWMPVQEFL